MKITTTLGSYRHHLYGTFCDSANLFVHISNLESATRWPTLAAGAMVPHAIAKYLFMDNSFEDMTKFCLNDFANNVSSV